MEHTDLVDKILSGEEDVEEVFGPSRISCDETTCISNTKGKCQKTNLNMTRRFCSSYQARGM